MLACVARAKPAEENGARAETTRTKDAVNSLSSQLKDMVHKFSGAHRQRKGGGRATSFRHRPQHPGDVADACLRTASSISTPRRGSSGVGTSEARGKATGSSANDCVPLQDDSGEHMEWIAQVEPGVQITFVSLPGGAGNDLKRIRFSREVFNRWQAQRWWGENYERIMELYNVHKFGRQALPSPPCSNIGHGGEVVSAAGACPTNFWPLLPSGREGLCLLSVPDPTEHIMQHNLQLSSSKSGVAAVGPQSSSCAREQQESVIEWVEQDEPGVYITIRALPDGTRHLRRIRFSRERFGDGHAKLWWEENRSRIQEQYI